MALLTRGMLLPARQRGGHIGRGTGTITSRARLELAGGPGVRPQRVIYVFIELSLGAEGGGRPR